MVQLLDTPSPVHRSELLINPYTSFGKIIYMYANIRWLNLALGGHWCWAETRQ